MEAGGGFRVADGVAEVAAADPGGLVSHDENVSQHAAVVYRLEEGRAELCEIK